MAEQKSNRRTPSSPRNHVRYYLSGLYQRIGEDHVLLLAGGLAFSLFACIIPLMFIIFAVLGNILEKTPITAEISSLVDGLIPYPDYAASIKEFIFSRVNEFTVHKNLAGVIGLVGLMFAASGLFSSMRTILNRVYRVVTTRSAIIGKLRDLGLVTLVLTYFLMATTILPTFGVIKGFAAKVEFLSGLRLGFLTDLAIETASFLVIVFVFAGMYLSIPQTKLPKRVITISALSAATLWLLAEQLFGLYITHAATLKRIYGAFTLFIVVAFWIYYTSVTFILGAEIGQLFRERMKKYQL